MEETRTDQNRSQTRADRLSLPLLLLMVLVLTRLTRFTRASLVEVAAVQGMPTVAAVDLDPSKLVAAAVMAILFAAIFVWPRRHLIRIDWPIRFLLIFIVYALLSTLWAYAPRVTAIYTLKLIQWPLLYIAIISLTRTAKDLDRWGKVMLIGSFIVLFGMIFERYAPPLAIGGATPEHTTHAYLTIYPQWAVFFLPFAVHFAMHGKSLRRRKWAILAIAASLLTVYLSFRRAGPLGVFVTLAVYMVLSGWRNRRLVGVFAIVLLLGAVAVVIDPKYAARMADVPGIGGTTFETWESQLRMFQYIVGFEVFLAHPITGVGLAGAQIWGVDHYGISLSQHNLLLKLASESGIVGMILFGAFALSAIKRGLVGLREHREHDDHLANESWSAATVANLIGILFWAQIQPLMQALPMYLAAAIVSSSVSIFRKARSAAS